jgi:hypothetical protein
MRVHVRVDGKSSAKKDPLHLVAHFLQQVASHAHPALAAAELFGNFRHAQPVHGQQLGDEFRLLEQVQAVVLGHAHQGDDSHRFLFAQTDVGHATDAQPLGAAVAFETVEQETPLGGIHAFERLFDAPLGDRRQKARFPSVVPHAVALIAEVEGRQFHVFAHATRPTAGVDAENAERTRFVSGEPCCVVSLFSVTRRPVPSR